MERIEPMPALTEADHLYFTHLTERYFDREITQLEFDHLWLDRVSNRKIGLANPIDIWK